MPAIFDDNVQGVLFEKHRPSYPSAVYETILRYLAGSANQTTTGKYKLAVDVGCGAGKSTLPLSAHFHSVLGVDPSSALLAEAQQTSSHLTNVSFIRGDASDLSFLPDNSVDLITVGMALHWFDVEKFFLESHRVLRQGGVLAAYGFDASGARFSTTGGRQLDEITKVRLQSYQNIVVRAFITKMIKCVSRV